MKDTVILKGQVKLVLKDKDGKIKKEVVKENLVVTVGKNEFAAILTDEAGGVRPTHIAVGTDNTAPDVADTVLVTEIFRKIIASTGRVDNKVTYTVSLAPGEATGALEEAGLFNDDTAGDLFARFLTGSFNKGINDSLDISWSILFT